LGGFPITKKKRTNEPPGVGGQRKGEMCGAKKRAKAWAKSHPEPRFLNAQCALGGRDGWMTQVINELGLLVMNECEATQKRMLA